MSAFCEDDQAVARYPQGIFGEARPADVPLIYCLQWGANVQGSERMTIFQSAKELTDTAYKDRLRVVFMPHCTQKTTLPDMQEFRKLFKYYSVPPDVLTERMRSVNHSFGSSQTIDSEAQISWCHFLCRNINLYSGKIQKVDYLRNGKGGQTQTSSAFDLWIMCDFFLHVAEDKSVTLLCFGAPMMVFRRFEDLLAKTSWEDVLLEPYLLYVIVFDELHQLLNSLILGNANSVMTIHRAAASKANATTLSFRQLHKIQQNVTFMIESTEAIISTLDAILESLTDFDTPTIDRLKKLRKSTVSAIRYRKRTFNSILLTAYSLERRATSSTQVYQGMVAQADSHAMKFIAVLTLIFLPVTGVATVFSSPFFNVDFDKDSTPLRVARCFWKFWAVVGPLTITICLLCYCWFQFPAWKEFLVQWKAQWVIPRRWKEFWRRQESLGV